MQISEPTLEIGDTAVQLLANSPATSTLVALGSAPNAINETGPTSLVHLRGYSIVHTLASFLNTNPDQPAQEDALTLIAETDDEATVCVAARIVVEEMEENN